MRTVVRILIVLGAAMALGAVLFAVKQRGGKGTDEK